MRSHDSSRLARASGFFASLCRSDLETGVVFWKEWQGWTSQVEAMNFAEGFHIGRLGQRLWLDGPG